jgi:hypothetical protein
MVKRAIRTRRTDIHGRDYFVWVASSGTGDSCGHDHPTKKLATECARLFPRFSSVISAITNPGEKP